MEYCRASLQSFWTNKVNTQNKVDETGSRYFLETKILYVMFLKKNDIK
jgi:hypothetical protein